MSARTVGWHSRWEAVVVRGLRDLAAELGRVYVRGVWFCRAGSVVRVVAWPCSWRPVVVVVVVVVEAFECGLVRSERSGDEQGNGRGAPAVGVVASWAGAVSPFIHIVFPLFHSSLLCPLLSFLGLTADWNLGLFCDASLKIRSYALERPGVRSACVPFSFFFWFRIRGAMTLLLIFSWRRHGMPMIMV